jgi:O-acetyl-ADP-ribose deacetylase (regulator of RNase III)
MIELARGNLLEAKTDALVNTVNIQGVMGKGIALQFKKAYPEMFRAYHKACKAGELRPGTVHVYSFGAPRPPRHIINFPTKRDWKSPSRLEDIQAGLKALADKTRELGLASVAIPPLGCGLGGLQWSEVFPLIQAAFADLPDVQVVVYPPQDAPQPEAMPDKTPKPPLTPARAAILAAIGRYGESGYPLLSLLEIQKLAYFLQVAGEPLKLSFQKERYGPYADELRHAMSRLETHYTLGVGDGRNAPDTTIRLLQGAREEAEAFLAERGGATNERLERVAALINGLETPYGMELLASVHWVATQETPPASTAEEAIQAIGQWSERKSSVLKPEHIQVAWDRLQAQGWV